jgi:hypothetical protein
VWETGQDPACRLVVECKQYKHSSTKNFAAAINDYASVLPTAPVVLANYGPVSPSVLQAVDPSVRPRCLALGGVHPEGVAAQRQFSEAVRKAVGEPNVAVVLEQASHEAHLEVLLIDISTSMLPAVKSDDGSKLISELITRLGIPKVASADDRLLAIEESSAEGVERALAARGSGSTNLGDAVRELGRYYETLLIVTDAEGASSINAPQPDTHRRTIEQVEVYIVLLRAGHGRSQTASST